VARPENAGVIADLRGRIGRTQKWKFFFLLLMPVGFIVPCGISLTVGKAAEKQEGFTPAQGFGVAAFVLPLVGLAGWLLMGGDKGKYKRSLAVAEEADALGFVYSEKADGQVNDLLRSIRMFRDADDQGGFNCISGMFEEKTVTLLDYDAVYRGTAIAMKFNRQTVVLVELAARVPDFRGGPKGWIDKIAQFFSAQVVEIPGEDRFNRNFIVCGDQKEDIRSLFTSDLLAALTEANGTFEVFQNVLVFYRHNQLFEPKDFEGMIRHLLRLARAIERCPQE
jgi:hypothetical protein